MFLLFDIQLLVDKNKRMTDETPPQHPPIKPYFKKISIGKPLGRPVTSASLRKAELMKAKPVENKKPRKHKIEDDDMIRRAILGLAKRGMTLDQIADIVGCSKSWLRAKYNHEIKSGKEIADALVVENLYQQAMKDTPASVQAGIYITKARMGWKDKQDDHELARPQVVFDFSGLDYEERLALRSKLQIKVNGPQTIDAESYDESE